MFSETPDQPVFKAQILLAADQCFSFFLHSLQLFQALFHAGISGIVTMPNKAKS